MMDATAARVAINLFRDGVKAFRLKSSYSIARVTAGASCPHKKAVVLHTPQRLPSVMRRSSRRRMRLSRRWILASRTARLL